MQLEWPPGAPANRPSMPLLAAVAGAHLVVFAVMAWTRDEVAPMTTTALVVDLVQAQSSRSQITDHPSSRQLAAKRAPAPPAAAAPQPKAAAALTPATAAPAKTAAAQPAVATAAAATSTTDAAATAGTQTAPRFDAAYLNNPAPVYPPLSRRAGEEGRVVLKVYVEPTGTPGTLQIQTSSGHDRLDRAALAAVSRWRFIAAKRGGDPVGAWVLVPIVFSLKVDAQ